MGQTYEFYLKCESNGERMDFLTRKKKGDGCFTHAAAITRGHCFSLWRAGLEKQKKGPCRLTQPLARYALAMFILQMLLLVLQSLLVLLLEFQQELQQELQLLEQPCENDVCASSSLLS